MPLTFNLNATNAPINPIAAMMIELMGNSGITCVPIILTSSVTSLVSVEAYREIVVLACL